MKKTVKIALSLALSFMLIAMTGVPFGSQVLASGTEELLCSGACGAQGDNLVWTLTKDYVLTISGSGEMAEYDLNEAPWSPESVRGRVKLALFNELGYASLNEADVALSSGELDRADYLKVMKQAILETRYSQYTDVTLVIEDGVTGISPDAFYPLHLADVTIPASLKNIPYRTLPVYGKLTLAGDFESFPNVIFEDWSFTDADMYSEYYELMRNVSCLAELAQEQPINGEAIENYVAYYLSTHEGAARDEALADLYEQLDAYAIVIAADFSIFGEGRDEIIAQAWQNINVLLDTEYPEDTAPSQVWKDEFKALIGEKYFGDPVVIYPEISFFSLGNLAEHVDAIRSQRITVTVPCDSAVREQLTAAGAASMIELSHSWGEWTDTVPATCAEPGVKTRACSACHAEETGVIAATGHPNARFCGETAATDTEHGHTEGVFCPDCGEWLSGDVIHNTFGERTNLDEYTEDGNQKVIIVCTVCGESGLYEMVPVVPEPTEENGLIPKIEKALRSFIEFILRLIKWLQGIE
ncbi:MAG: hypothetical protein K6G71_09140 [Clostridiales bacterium]|nr:hypothetical protein [Clostridiales bacterium]